MEVEITMQSKHHFVLISLLILLSTMTVFSESDSILVLAEKSSYQFAPEYPDSLDIMYYSPLIWIKEGIRFAAGSKGNDLKGYVFLLECYFNGKVKCIKCAGPNKNKFSRVADFLDTAHFKPWTKSVADLYGSEPVRLLITWSKEDCYIENLIDRKTMKAEESKLFVREWKGFNCIK